MAHPGWMEVEALGAQAKRQDESGGSVNKDDETTVAERDEEPGELRDPPAKGSYYNKFVGGLRSGNNSELRATLRMCLSLLLFKWKWKATSCNGCDLYLRLSPFTVSFLYLYGVLSLSSSVGVLLFIQSD